MEQTPNTHPDDDLAAIAADLAAALQNEYVSLTGTRRQIALQRYERWLREQQYAHPVRPKQDVPAV